MSTISSVSDHGIGGVLNQRRKTADAALLLTYYDVPAGHRTELSATSFANWVHKTANLLEELGAEPGDEVWAPLLGTHPGHWVGSVWTVACWLAGTTVSVAEPGAARIGVTGPEGAPGTFGGTVVACSLHPLGLGFAEGTPGDLDYADVLTQPDDYLTFDRDDSEDLARRAWTDTPQTLGEVLAVPARDDRFLVVPRNPFEPLSAALVPALLGAGSVVMVTGGGVAERARIAGSERATQV